MRLADGGPEVRQLQALAQVSGQIVFERRQRFEHAVSEDPQHPRGELLDALIDRNDAAGVERGLALFVVAR